MTTEKIEAYQEPTGDHEPAGYHRYRRPLTSYERFMEEEGVPIFRGMGVYDVRQLSLGPWKRLGGRGIFLQLDGCGGIRSMYVVEVPAGGVLNAERHFYDEFMYVVEGRGSTEVWREGSAKKQAFEWQAGSLFTIPINTHHRLVNATTSPALILAATNAPPIMNIFQNRNYIFDNPYEFRERYDESEDFFKAREEVELESTKGRAQVRSNVFSDIVNVPLPLDNQRAPGYRRFHPHFQGFCPYGVGQEGFIAEYSVGRYSKGHYHAAGAVLVCLRGKGYSYNWHKDLGQRPWENGKGHLVKVQEYIPGGLVAAAPGGGDWFHQHFGLGKGPALRVINFWAGPSFDRAAAEVSNQEEEIVSNNIYSVEEGGRTIYYRNEDPYIRKTYKAALEQEGVELDMPEEQYQ